jgi:hypothetical protein
MKPLYFPFTYISDPITEALTACLGTIRVYQLFTDSLPADMQSWVAQGRLECVVPLQKIATRLKQACRFCYDWARDHQTDMDPFLIKAMDQIPYYEATSAFRIRSDISRILPETHETQAKSLLSEGQRAPDNDMEVSLFKAALFLQMAQDLDIRRDGIHADLQSLDEIEQQVLATLKGDDEKKTETIVNPLGGTAKNKRAMYPSEDEHIVKRLSAWTHLLRQDPDPGGIFVTTSGAVVTRLMEAWPVLRRAGEISCENGQDRSIGMGGDQHREEQYCRYLERLADEGSTAVPMRLSDGEHKAGSLAATPSTSVLSIYLAENISPLELFCRASGLNVTPSGSCERRSPPCRHTVIAWFHEKDAAT